MADNQTTAAGVVARVLCFQDVRSSRDKDQPPCPFCDGSLEQCKAWEDYLGEAQEIVSALDTMKDIAR